MLFVVENELGEMDRTRRDGPTSPDSFATFRNKMPAVNAIFRRKRTRRNGSNSARWINFAGFVYYFSKQTAGNKCYFAQQTNSAQRTELVDRIWIKNSAKWIDLGEVDQLRRVRLLLFEATCRRQMLFFVFETTCRGICYFSRQVRSTSPNSFATFRFSKQHAGGKCYSSFFKTTCRR